LPEDKKAMFCACSWVALSSLLIEAPNGWRYPLVGGTRQRHFDGTSFKPRKLLKNAHAKRPTSRVHAVLGGFDLDPYKLS
jgi:hypothetical protein